MKKQRVPASIDKEIHQRIKLLLKMQPGLGFKKISGFVNTTLEKELEKLENERIFKLMKEKGMENVLGVANETQRGIAKLLGELNGERKERAEFRADLEKSHQEVQELAKLAKEVKNRLSKKKISS